MVRDEALVHPLLVSPEERMAIKEAQLAKKEAHLKGWAHALGVIELLTEEDPRSGDLVIRVRRQRVVAMQDPGDPKEYAKACEIIHVGEVS